MDPERIYPAGTAFLVKREGLPLSPGETQKPLTWSAIQRAAAIQGFRLVAVYPLDP
jgi:hypothetical protein